MMNSKLRSSRLIRRARHLAEKQISLFLIIVICVGLPFICPAGICMAQSAARAPDSLRSLAPKIYIDCADCDENDLDYIRSEINFVNFVRDRFEADVFILITGQTTGSGGSEITMEFSGQHKFEGKDDTLKYFTGKSDSDEMTLAGATRALKMGLMRYMAGTPLANYMTVNYAQPSKPAEVVDRWNYWVFEASVSGGIQGQKSYRQFYDNISLSAERVTDANKLTVSGWLNYNETRWNTPDFNSLSISRGKGGDITYVRSLGPHWSLGSYASVSSSSYSNQESVSYLAGLIEYDIFPYSESTRRLLSLRYRQGLYYMDYYEETIYDRHNQWLSSGRLSLISDIKRFWGSIYGSISATAYTYDLHKNRLSLSTQISVRLLKGLSLDISSNASRVRDQISLSKTNLSKEDVLLRIREMATSYDYWVSLGLSYTFGSIYNNIVNPRMEN